MYFGPKKHVLSGTIMLAAIIRIGCAACSLVIRFIVRKAGSSMPDMADTVIWNTQTLFSVLALLLTIFVFYVALRRVDRFLDMVPKEDQYEMAKLQEEFLGSQNAALSADAIRKLLQLWLAILAGAQIMYDFSSEVYRRFAIYLANAISDGSGATGEAYVYLYNLTHSFKYQGMLIALLLGAMMTGIFLGDWGLRITIIVIAVLFMISGAGLGMMTVSILGQSVGLVWSSGIFHLIETGGLVILALYLRFRYHGI